jgi:hypothetical protein
MPSTITSFGISPTSIKSVGKITLRVLVPRTGKVTYAIAGNSVTFSNGKNEKTVNVKMGDNPDTDTLKGPAALVKISAKFNNEAEKRHFVVEIQSPV